MSRLILSVAMATYNGALYLSEQLDSLARQQRVPDELVICDEGSTDGTMEIIRDFAKSAPFPVRLHANAEQLGVAKNFEQAATLCGGDIVLFCDQDDVWLPTKLAAIEQLFDDSPRAQVILNDAALVDANLHSSGATQLGNISRTGFRRSQFVTGCCSAHRRAFHDLAFPIPGGMPVHDLWINGLAHYLSCSLISPDVLQLYRRHGTNESEWLLSDPSGTSRSSAFRHHGLKDARPGWARWIAVLSLFIDRIETRRAIAARFADEGSVDEALARLREERSRMEQRVAFCSQPRWRRSWSILSFQFAGGYRDASGWLSAAKDLIRP